MKSEKLWKVNAAHLTDTENNLEIELLFADTGLHVNVGFMVSSSIMSDCGYLVKSSVKPRITRQKSKLLNSLEELYLAFRFQLCIPELFHSHKRREMDWIG